MCRSIYLKKHFAFALLEGAVEQGRKPEASLQALNRYDSSSAVGDLEQHECELWLADLKLHDLHVLEDWVVGVSFDDFSVSVHLGVHLILEHIEGASQKLHLDLYLRDYCRVDQRRDHEARDGRDLDVDSLAGVRASLQAIAGGFVFAAAEEVAHCCEVVVIRLGVESDQLHAKLQSR